MGESTDRSVSRCAVVIPTYNGATLTRACLQTLLGHPPTASEWQLIVVDDGSEDETREMLDSYGSAITVVTHERNRGFATACNSGARASEACEFLVFLNNDTIPTAGWLDALVNHAERMPHAAAVGAKLLFPNGAVQHAGVVIAQNGWPRHLYAGFPGDHPAVNRPRPITAVTAACVLIRRERFDEFGGFDEAFSNGYEDIDLCHRMTEAGHEIWYCPSSVVYHFESVTRWPTGIPQTVEQNSRLYADRWRDRIVPDDFTYYLQDGLLQAEYGPYDPFTLSVSPHLATVRQDGAELEGVERLLSLRANQVMHLLAAETRVALREGRPEVPISGHEPSRARTGNVLSVGNIHELGGSRGRHLVSLLLPVKNQEYDVRDLLPLILGQNVSARLEIVAVDSGSNDGTVEALEEFGATVIGIDPSDFDHGLTRNLAARHATGDVMLFVSGRSRPADEHWLGPLLAVLDEDPQAAGVCSRVIPRQDADILTTKDGNRELSGSTVRDRKVISDWQTYRNMSVERRRAFLNFHTVSAAIRTDVFAQIQFRSVPTLGEDLLWARDVTEAGWSLWHEPASTTYHSHEYTVRDLFARNVDDGLANSEINDRTLSEREVVPLIRSLVLDDWSYLRDTLQMEGEELDRWQIDSALRRAAQVAGQWVGVNHSELPPEAIAVFSGVHRARMRR